MITTRAVIALAALPVFVGVIVALRQDREVAALWLLALGSGLATAWAGLSFVWANNFESYLPANTYIALAVTGGVTTYYFSRRALEIQYG